MIFPTAKGRKTTSRRLLCRIKKEPFISMCMSPRTHPRT